MTAQAIIPNTKLRWNGDLLAVVGNPKQNEIYLQSKSSNEIRKTTLQELSNEIQNGTAELIQVQTSDKALKDRLHTRLKQQIDLLPEPLKASFMRKYAYVKAIYKHGAIPKSKDRLQPVILEAAKDLHDDSPPSFSTVCKWLKEYRSANCDPRALIPSNRQRGNRARRIKDEVIEIIHKAIEDRYLNLQQGTARSVMDLVVKTIHEENEIRISRNKLDLPDMRTIYREIERVDEYTKDKARLGRSVADQRHQIIAKAPIATRPLERVEIDHTVLNLFLIDEETGAVLGRPTITIAVDAFTRWIIGFYIGFEPPGWQSVMHCLRNVILSKEILKEKFPSIINDWQSFGVPETIIVDNGREFHSTSLELACEQLGVQIQYSPRAKPWFKAKVERLFGSINTMMLSGTQGAILSKAIKDTEYNPQKDAIADLNQFTEAFYKWVVDVYSQSFHEGINKTPAAAWAEAIEDLPPLRIISSIYDLLVILSTATSRTIQRYGIELNGITYQSEELGKLRRKLIKGSSPRVDVKFDPSDLGYIHVYDESTADYIRVPANDLSYAHGLNLYEQKIYLRWKNRQRTQTNIEISLVEAREQVRAILKQATDMNLPIASSRRVARLNGRGSNQTLSVTPTERFDPEPIEPATSEEKSENLTNDLRQIESCMDDQDNDEMWGICDNDDYPE